MTNRAVSECTLSLSAPRISQLVSSSQSISTLTVLEYIAIEGSLSELITGPSQGQGLACPNRLRRLISDFARAAGCCPGKLCACPDINLISRFGLRLV